MSVFEENFNNQQENFEEQYNYDDNITDFNFINERELTKLDLDIANINQESLRSFNENLKINTTLLSLKIYCSDDYFFDGDIFKKVIEYLSEFLKVNNILTVLDLSYNDITFNRTFNRTYDNPFILLCDALKVNTNLTVLNLNRTELQNRGLIYLSEALQNNKSLTELYLKGNRQTEKDYREQEGYYNEDYGDDYDNIGFCYGIRSLSNVLKNNVSLTKIDLGNNYIYKNDVNYLWKALLSNTTLTSLNLDNNKIGEEIEEDDLIENITLGDVLKVNSILTEISLSWNYLNNDDIKDICEGLRANTSLNSLSLSNNEIDDEGINYINEVLKVNKTLNTLNLKRNHISNITKQSLFDTLKNNTSLIELDLD